MDENNVNEVSNNDQIENDTEVTSKKFKTGRLICSIIFGLLFVTSAALLSLSVWYENTFNITFSDLMFTLLSPVSGTGEETVTEIVISCLPAAIACVVVYVVATILLWKENKLCKILRRVGAAICALSLVLSVVYTLFAFKIVQHLAMQGGKSELYETEYIDPADVKITDNDGNAKNLIYIYLESMETTYASKDVGGEQDGVNYMPHMTELAEEHLSFSDGEGLGGFRSISGTGWTMGALMGTTSGVPFSLAVFGEGSNNSLGKDGTFLDSMVTIGDILEEKGYNQEFLCGSKASFGGRKTYFEVHGNYEIFDLYTAREEGYIPEDYYVWWGYEDHILYEIAKNEILELAEKDEPFNFTMLTVDPHHNRGYICEKCGNDYPVQLANVIQCADRLLYSFIEWCKTQDFYEDTTIVIVGDHPRMDMHLVSGVDWYDRTVYNCIINPAVDEPSENRTQNRVYTSLDMFPTVLAAMGFEIEGERLGLGTNLFSVVPTLCEKYGEGRDGYDWLDGEVNKKSDYYIDRFVEGKKD